MSPTKPAFLKRIGKQVRNKRTELGMSQEDLAGDAGLNMFYVGRIERGEANAPIYTIHKLSRVLRLNILDIS